MARENDKQSFFQGNTIRFTLSPGLNLEPHAKNIACANGARCGALFTLSVAYMGIAIACKRLHRKTEKGHSPLLPS